MSTLRKSTFAALVLLGAGVLSGFSATTAAFSDRGQSSGNSLAAATLPAPVNLTAVARGGGDSVDLDWDSAPGDFADGWEVFRHDGDCTGWTPAEPDIIGTSPSSSYTDSAVSVGNTYCYAVRGTFSGWDSPLSSPASDTTELTVTRLYTHNAGGGSYQLIASPGSGAEPFGCNVLNVNVLLPLLSACADIGGPAGADQYVFQSPSTYDVYGNDGWAVSLNLDWAVVLNLAIGGSREISVQAWYAAGACGAPPGGGASLIGTGTISFWGFLLQLLNVDNQTLSVNLVANPAFVEPASPQTICLSAAMSPSLIDADLLARVDVVNGGGSYIEGPFGP